MDNKKNYYMCDFVAKEYGAIAGVLYSNIEFWLDKNKANNKHFHNNKFWTYNSMRAFTLLFPMFTEDQIRNSLKKMIEGQLLIKGNFNKMKYDRTSWYSINYEKAYELQNAYSKYIKSIWDFSQMETTETPNGNDENPEPIPYNNTYNNTDERADITSPPPFENDCYYDEDTGYYTDKPKSNNIVEKIQNQFGIDNEYNKFTTEIVKVFTELTCKTATDIIQVHGFKTPQKQQELKEIFNNRKYNWKQAIDLAKEQAIKRPDVSKHFLEFTQLLPIFLTKGAEGIKRELSQAEIKAKQEAELNKKTDLELDAEREKMSIEKYLDSFEGILERRYKFYTEDLQMPEEKALDIINSDRDYLKRKIKEHNDVRKTQYSI